MVGAFDFKSHEGYICTRHRDVLSFFLHKTIFLLFVHHGNKFYNRYIKPGKRKKYIDAGGGGGVKTK